MKLQNLLLGIIVFSVIAYIFFDAAYEIGNNYQSRDYLIYQNLTSDYNYINESNTRAQEISSGLNTTSCVSCFIPGLKESIDAARTIKNSLTTTNKISEKVVSDFGMPKIFYDALVIGFFTTLTIIIFIMIRGTKPDSD